MSSVDARMARPKDRASAAAERSEEQHHVYYALLKAGTLGDLALMFKERLGADKNVHVKRASPQKMVVKIKGNRAFVDKIKTAMEAFPEVRAAHKKTVPPGGLPPLW